MFGFRIVRKSVLDGWARSRRDLAARATAAEGFADEMARRHRDAERKLDGMHDAGRHALDAIREQELRAIAAEHRAVAAEAALQPLRNELLQALRDRDQLDATVDRLLADVARLEEEAGADGERIRRLEAELDAERSALWRTRIDLGGADVDRALSLRRLVSSIRMTEKFRGAIINHLMAEHA